MLYSQVLPSKALTDPPNQDRSASWCGSVIKKTTVPSIMSHRDPSHGSESSLGFLLWKIWSMKTTNPENIEKHGKLGKYEGRWLAVPLPESFASMLASIFSHICHCVPYF